MALPGLDIKFENGNIGTVTVSEDGVFGLLASAVAVAGKFALNTAYTLKGMADVAKLGIVPDLENYILYKWIKEYYAEAGEGAELWIMGFAQDTKPSDWFTPNPGTGKAPAETLLNAANGRLSALFTAFYPDNVYEVVEANGLDQDVAAARTAAQALAVNYTSNLFTPLFIVLEGYAFSGDPIDLADLNEESNNRVAVFIGDTKKASAVPATVGASSASLAGRLAVISVSENAGMAKRGALATLTAFIGDTAVELFDVAAIHDKNYITFRKQVRKAGYFISDDPLATDPVDDDYSHISRRRVIDKVFRIAHSIVSDEVLADFDVTNEGKISPFYAKPVEGRVEQAIFNQMTVNGELSRDQTNPNDLGVVARFNTDINVAQTGRTKLSIKVRPRGTSRFIDVLLGFDVNLNE